MGDGVDGGATEELICAVCFENVSQRLELPCACRVDFCASCWDQSLAKSLVAAGQPRCPTCRTPVHVDFDVEEGHLVFSREEQDSGLAEDAQDPQVLADRQNHNVQEVVERLARQALPMQKRLLRSFGEASGALLEISAAEGPPEAISKLPLKELKEHLAMLGTSAAGCVEKSDLVLRLREAAGGSWGHLASYCASAGFAGEERPRCVCGSPFKRILGEERMQQFITDFYQVPRDSPQFRRYLGLHMDSGMGTIVCDLCEENVSFEIAVWSCESGGTTVLHATSYDVCDKCFVQHAFAQAGAPAAV